MKTFSVLAAMTVMGVACASAESSDRPETPEELALVRSCAEGARAGFEGESRLSADLRQALTSWKIDSCYARSGLYPDLSPADIDARRVSVIVTSTAALSTLSAAGLETGVESGEDVSGIIAFRDLERLAALPEVTAIAMEPHVEPL